MDASEAERALRESERRLAEAQSLAHLGSYEWDIPSNTVVWSDELYRIYGLTKGTFAATAQAFLDQMHPDDRAMALQVSLEAKATLRPFSYHYRIIRPDGAERIIHGRGRVVADDEGRPLRMYGTAQDVTERVLMEREAEKAQRLESVGLLAAGIAHDFNNILMGLVGNISLAKTHLRPGEKAHQLLAVAEAAAIRAGGLTKQLLTFSKGGEPVKKPLDTRRILEDTVTFALRGSKMKGAFAWGDGLWPLEADEGQIAQVFHNLSINAAQAAPGGGTLTVRAENADLAAPAPPLRRGRYVRITVRDSGPGIPAEHLGKVFEPYFTTKKKGSGLGLAVCRSIVEKHGGAVDAGAAPGGGALFTVLLPASEKASVEAPDARTPRRGEGRVLLMDDDALVRETARGMLERLGYKVESAADGAAAAEAFEKARAAGRPFDAAIMDLTVPGGLGGKEAAALILAAEPGARLIASSGYSDDPVMARPAENGFRAVLHKPYEIVELSETVYRVISRL